MKAWIPFVVGSLLAFPAMAKEAAPSIIRYTPPEDAPPDRPLAVEISFAPKGTDLVVHLTYDKLPWGEECKARCANTTVFFDTDDNKDTGLQLGKDKPETGADLALIVQGVRQYKEKSADLYLRARVRLITDGATDVEHGEVIADLHNRDTPDRLKADKRDVTVTVDATSLTIPTGKTMRAVYHPPADKAIEAKGKGMLTTAADINPAAFKNTGKKKRRR